MSFEDRSLNCVECNAEFTFTADEQQSFATRGYTNDPKRCPSCRETRRSQRSGYSGDGGGYGMRRQMYPAVCARCGAETQVPFEPRGIRPVYCSSCYQSSRPAGGSSRR
ncbi:MAG: zinc-ribbon domain containing protein [Dehalococcoidia bacterium]|nr:zinc-ribbon domain containing protein [Dehalococcoidia bacterium]